MIDIQILYLISIAVLFGGMMHHLAKKNCVENPKEKHLFLKIAGGLSIITGTVFLVVGILYMSDLETLNKSYMQSMSNQYDYVKSLMMRSQIETTQKTIISDFTLTINFIGLGIYFWCFRKSGTNWWQKTLKVVAYTLIFICLSHVAQLDFNKNLNPSDFIPYGLLLLLSALCLINWRGTNKDQETH